MTLMYRLFGIPKNSVEMTDKVDRRIERLKQKVKERKGRVDIVQQLDAFSAEGITHYTCYLQIKSKGVFGSINVPVTGRNYTDRLESSPQVTKMKNNDCADAYERALDFAKRFIDEGLEVLVDGKSIEEIKEIIHRIRGGEFQSTAMIPAYGSPPM